MFVVCDFEYTHRVGMNLDVEGVKVVNNGKTRWSV